MAEPRTHVVAQGEHISAIAAHYGLSDWRTLWDANAALHSERESPHQLLPGDVLTIPAERAQKEAAATEQEHVIELDREFLALRIVVLDEDLEPIPNAPYQLQIEREAWEGTTDPKGCLTVTGILPTSTRATLTVRRNATVKEGVLVGAIPCVWELEIGGLHPAMENPTSGVEQRLRNLGFLADAVRKFRKRFGLRDSDRIDSQLLSRVKSAHDTLEAIPPEKK